MENSANLKSGRNAIAPAIALVRGHQVFNEVLLVIPKQERAAVFSKLEYFLFPVATVLIEVGAVIQFVYFLNEGFASTLSLLEDGNSVEVGVCGKEGFVGTPLIAGFKSSAVRVVMQARGSGFRMSANDFLPAMRDSRKLAAAVHRSAQEQGLQASQTAVCNRVHEVNERVARWLLMSQDRLGGNLIPMTHESIAGLLGTRRASISVAAHILQGAGLISYTRGLIKIESRKLLEGAACECYAIMTRQLDKWHNERN
jgi:CRP-like cAMP-binding protein